MGKIDFEKNFAFTSTMKNGVYVMSLDDEKVSIQEKVKLSDETVQAYGLPTLLQRLEDGLMAGIGSYNDEPVKCYKVFAEDGRQEYLGELPSSICQFCTVGDKIYTFRAEYSETGNAYFMERFDISDLTKREASYTVSGIPKKILYDANQKKIYMLIVGEEQASMLMSFDIASEEMKSLVIDEQMYASDFMKAGGFLYVLMSGKSEQNEIIYDNRVLIYKEDFSDLEQVVTVDDSPELIECIDDSIYIYFANETQYIKKYDSQFQVTAQYDMDADYIMDCEKCGDTLYYVGESSIYVLKGEELTELAVDGAMNLNFVRRAK